MTDDHRTRRFYDELASDYDLIFADWDASIDRQQAILTSMLGELGITPPATVLDCAAGIGTQAIGLACAGLSVTATDISADAVARGEMEATARGVTIDWAVADMRALAAGDFDAVVCCDNALPHLLTDDDLRAALVGIHGALRADGVFLASIRDYDDLRARRPTGTEPQLLRDTTGRRRVVGQAWEWHGDEIEVALFVLHETVPEWTAAVHSMRYRALRRDELAAALRATGFDDVRWWNSSESGYYQPIVTARARSQE